MNIVFRRLADSVRRSLVTPTHRPAHDHHFPARRPPFDTELDLMPPFSLLRGGPR
jgi:hypothetical protein